MNQFKKFFVIAIAAIMMIALTACGSGSNNASSSSGSSSSSSSSSGIQSITIKISHVVSQNTPKDDGAQAMKQYIESHSNGKIKVQVYPNASLFGDKDEVDNLIANNVQFIIPDMAKLASDSFGFSIPSMPFIFKNDQAAYKFWDGTEGQKVLGSLQGQGIVGLKMWPNGPTQLTNNVRPVTKPSDLKGMKIRVQGGDVLADTYKTLGAGPTNVAFSELYTALSQHTVDAEINTYSNIYTKKFDEVQKYMTTNWGASRVDYALLTNTKFWNSLNDATKKVVQGGIDAGTKVARDQAQKLNEDAAAQIKKNGNVQIHELTDAERQVFIDALQPLYDKYKDKIGADVLQAAIDANK